MIHIGKLGQCNIFIFLTQVTEKEKQCSKDGGQDVEYLLGHLPSPGCRLLIYEVWLSTDKSMS